MSKQSSPPKALRVDVERRGDTAIIKLAGSANMDAAEHLRERLVKLVEVPMAQLIVDLSELHFVSSVGLGAIVAAHLRCRHYDCALKLVAPPPEILELLEVTRLTKLFPVYDSVDSAIALS